MSRYVGGPLDGREIRTKFDHLPIIVFPWPDSIIELPETEEGYELRHGVRHHVYSRPYPAPGAIP